MNFNEYQVAATKTASYPQVGFNLMYPALGLAGEAGEVAEKIKKISRNNNVLVPSRLDVDVNLALKESIIKELGDVLWYVAAISSELGVSLYDVANKNIEKLLDRQARGVLKSEGDNR